MNEQRELASHRETKISVSLSLAGEQVVRECDAKCTLGHRNHLFFLVQLFLFGRVLVQTQDGRHSREISFLLLGSKSGKCIRLVLRKAML